MRKDGSLFDARMYVSPLIDPQGPADRLDDLDDQHHRGQAHPRPAVGLARALHHRARGPRRRGVGAVGAAGRAAVRQPLVPPVVRRRRARAMRSSPAAACRSRPYQHDGDDAVDGLSAACRRRSSPRPAPIRARSTSSRCSKWFDVRSRYLQWTDGRLAQMLIATDITARRRVEEQAAQQAEKAQVTSRLVTMGEMASSVAHELNQPLTAITNYCNGMVSRVRGESIGQRGPVAGAGEDLAPGRARGADHPAHPRLREASSEPQRQSAQARQIVEDARRSGRHRAAPPQRRDPQLRGAAPARR